MKNIKVIFKIKFLYIDPPKFAYHQPSTVQRQRGYCVFLETRPAVLFSYFLPEKGMFHLPHTWYTIN